MKSPLWQSTLLCPTFKSLYQLYQRWWHRYCTTSFSKRSVMVKKIQPTQQERAVEILHVKGLTGKFLFGLDYGQQDCGLTQTRESEIVGKICCARKHFASVWTSTVGSFGTNDYICWLNPFTPDSAKSKIDKFSTITNWVKMKKKQHHNKVLLRSFPMNGDHTLALCPQNKKLEHFVSPKVSLLRVKRSKVTLL